MTDSYFLPSGYESRLDPQYFVDDDLNAVWQPDVYPEAAALARRLGARRIVDVGCGTASKLVALHPEFEIVGIDYGTNIASCRARYDFGTWIEADFDRDESLGLAEFAGAFLVCADVIEHLIRPERLLKLLRDTLDRGAVALSLSTPERVLYNEPGHLGPPPNQAHVREWAIDELQRFMESFGLHGHFGLTRSNDVMPYMQTILAVVPGPNADSQRIVTQWWEERARWQERAVAQDRLIAENERWTRELAAAKDWAEGQRAAWQVRAEAAEEYAAGWQRRAEDAEEQLVGRLAPGGLAGRLLDPRASGDDAPESPGPVELPPSAPGPDHASTPAASPTGQPQVTVVTEVDGDAVGLDGCAASLEAQTFTDWEWLIVSTREDVASPLADSRVRVVHQPSRARALREALQGSGDVVLLGLGQALRPTTLEKWVWFLEAHPACASVTSSTPAGAESPRLIRRSVIDAAGGLDAAAEIALASAGFVPIPHRRQDTLLHRAPYGFQKPNEWLPAQPSIRNPIAVAGRRLLLIVPWMTVGGADKFNLDLLDQLGRLGWGVTVATTIDGSHELYPEYEQRTSDLFPFAHFLPLPHQPLFLRYLIDTRRPDAVVISNSELGYRLLPYLRGLCPDTPLVDFCHSEAEHWNNGGYPRFSIEYRHILDLTMTTSEHLRRWMIERGGNPQRIEVCHANVDTEAFRPAAAARDELRARYDLPDEPIVLFVGRISEDKQPRVLANALIRLNERGVRFTAVIAGDGPDLPWLQATLRKNGLTEKARLLGAVAGSEIPSLMRAADVFFMPSRSEGIALALYEAMASATPVVAARVGGQSELVTEDCGFLIERSSEADEVERYASALELLLQDPQRCAAMGAASRARAETSFPLDRMGERFEELLERAIELHRSEPQPVPAPAFARTSATEAVELMRLAELAETAWTNRLRGGAVRGAGVTLYLAVRQVGRPAYRWGMRRGWTWLPRLRNALSRALAGIS